MKYKLTDETITHWGRTLHRIQALKDFGDVKAGDSGGWIQSEKNLSQDGNCWVYDEAKVFGKAWISGNARISGNAQIFDNAFVFGNASVSGYAWVSGNARVSGNALVYNWLCLPL